ncbi:MAG: ribosomal protein S18-alanine N-acetyltransferase [Bdellovibrionota bacterium]|nr:MAG: ribosomal protein S18-alanine N-acetyltransferase [Bdellovibrionota bacterium]
MRPLNEDAVDAAAVRPRSVVCRVGPECVADLAAIERTANTPPWSEKLFLQEFQNPCARTYGARLGGVLVGFLVAHIVIDEAHILNLAVREDVRGCGIGTTLLKEFLNEAASLSVKWVTLEVRESNSVAKHLYSKVGFFEIGVRPKYYSSNQEDALVLKLDLVGFVTS